MVLNKKQNKIIFFIYLVVAFFILFASETKAAIYSCVKNDVCSDVSVSSVDYYSSQTECVSSGGEFYREACKHYACVVNSICQDLSVQPNLGVTSKCVQRGGKFFVKSCSQLKRYGCVVNSQCTNIFVDDYNDSGCAGELLRSLCPTVVGDCSAAGSCSSYSCIVIKDPENKLKPGDCRDFQSANKNDAIAEARNLCASTLAEADRLKIYEGSCAGSDRDPSINRGETADQLLQKAATTLNPGGINTPFQLIRKAINALMAFIGSITLLLYVISGFLWMTASGNAEQVDKAKKILIWTTLGVFVMLFSYMLVNFLFNSIPSI